jgi:glyoxylase-like metal-dependent hydrolase (beta-lactamase superfamily II)
MKVHYLDCATLRPHGAKLFVPEQAEVPSTCVLVEAGDRLVLVDSGFGLRDMADPSRLGFSNHLLNAVTDPGRTAVRRVASLGFDPADVTDIICTHLDRDHAGGLSDFPRTRVHVTTVERDAALEPQGHKERDRYRRCHFEHGPDWVTHGEIAEEKWFGMECLRTGDIPRGILMVPLAGHTRGHCGVAVDTDEGWLLHCGDAFYVAAELNEADGPGIGLRTFRRIAHCDYREAMRQLDRIRLAVSESGNNLILVAAHDPGGATRVQVTD